MNANVAHSPADILRYALVGKGIGVLRSQNTANNAWPIFCGHLPDIPDNAICTYDTTGIGSGRIMATGETIRHPGWQIRLRAKSNRDAWLKMGALKTALDGMLRLAVSIGSDTYTIAAVTQTSDVLSLGQETDAVRREQLTLNGTLTFIK